jgi:hypothetical protein
MRRTWAIVVALAALELLGVMTSSPTRAQDRAEAAADSVELIDVFDLLERYVLGRRIEPSLEGETTGLKWAFVPTVSYNPVYGLAAGALVSGSGRRGSLDSPYSSLSISGNYSTEGQTQFQARGDVFSRGGNYLLKLDGRYLDTARSTWGLGDISSQTGEFPMSFVLVRAYATLMRRVRGPVFIGVGFHHDEFSDIVDERARAGESTPFTEYSGGAPNKTMASGLSLNLLADTRDNLVNPRRGYYVSWSLRDYGTILGGDTNWQEMWAEARLYPTLPAGSRSVLAFWIYTWMTFGPAPYLNLPSNGWDTYGRGARGYLAGRFRGIDQLYLESEYRFSLTKNELLGLVVFANGTVTTGTQIGPFGNLDPGVGLGLRIKFNKNSDTNLAIDHAWGRANSTGLFLGLSEVF